MLIAKVFAGSPLTGATCTLVTAAGKAVSTACCHSYRSSAATSDGPQASLGAHSLGGAPASVPAPIA